MNGKHNRSESSRRAKLSCWADGCLRLSFCAADEGYIRRATTILRDVYGIREIALDFSLNSPFAVGGMHSRYLSYFGLSEAGIDIRYVANESKRGKSCEEAIFVFRNYLLDFLKTKRTDLDFFALYGANDADCDDFLRLLPRYRVRYFVCNDYCGKNLLNVLQCAAKLPYLRLLALSGCKELAAYSEEFAAILKSNAAAAAKFLESKTRRLTYFDRASYGVPSTLQRLYCNIYCGTLEYVDISRNVLSETFYQRTNAEFAYLPMLCTLDIQGSEVQLARRTAPSGTTYEQFLTLFRRFRDPVLAPNAFNHGNYQSINDAFVLTEADRRILGSMIGTMYCHTLVEQKLSVFYKEIFSLDFLFSANENAFFYIVSKCDKLIDVRAIFSDYFFKAFIQQTAERHIETLAHDITTDKHFKDEIINASNLRIALNTHKSLSVLFSFPSNRYFPSLGLNSALDEIEALCYPGSRKHFRVRMFLEKPKNAKAKFVSLYQTEYARLLEKARQHSFSVAKPKHCKREAKTKQTYRPETSAYTDGECGYHDELQRLRTTTEGAVFRTVHAENALETDKLGDMTVNALSEYNSYSDDIYVIYNAYLNKFGLLHDSEDSIAQNCIQTPLYPTEQAKCIAKIALSAIDALPLQNRRAWYTRNKEYILSACEDAAEQLNAKTCSYHDAKRYLEMRLGELEHFRSSL